MDHGPTLDLWHQHAPQTSTWSLVAVETMDISMSPRHSRTIDLNISLSSSMDHRCQHGLRWLHRPLTSAWPPAGVWPMDISMAFGGATYQGPRISSVWPSLVTWVRDINMDHGCCRTTDIYRNLGIPHSPGKQTTDTKVTSRNILSLHRTSVIVQLDSVLGLSQSASFRPLHTTLSTHWLLGKGHVPLSTAGFFHTCHYHWVSSSASLHRSFTAPSLYVSHLSNEYLKNFSFISSHLLILGLNACASRVLFRKSYPLPVSSRIFPTFSSHHIQGIESLVEVLDPYGVEFCALWEKMIYFILPHVAFQLDKHNLLKMLPFPQYVLLASLQKIRQV